MSEQVRFHSAVGGETILQFDEAHTWLQRLFGLPCGLDGSDAGTNRVRGLALISTSQGRFEGDSLLTRSIKNGENWVDITWQAGKLELSSHWEMDSPSGVISRRDRLSNPSGEPLTVFRCFARFPFPPGAYEIYRQESQWCYENQGGWLALQTGGITLHNEWGRSTNGGTPLIGLRPASGQSGVAFHLLARGNWAIRAERRIIGQQILPMCVLEMGQSDEDLRLELKPGESADLPEILIQPWPAGDPYLSTSLLHEYALKHFFAAAKNEPPVVYNTWFYQFDRLDVPSLLRQLTVAREVGCEIFVIDAGWFGPESPGWWRAAGDWREKTGSSFLGRMNEFAELVRSAGLGFGLWMEPERFNRNVPVVCDHPDWFISAEDPTLLRINLQIPAAYDYLKSEICRLVETYQLAWMKIDFNFELGLDPSGAELLGYYERWYALLDEIRAKYPATFFEGCSSGGMRLDLESLRHFDAQFLTDTVNPVDVIRIGEGARLRLPPGRLTQWCVLRSAGKNIPVYSDPMGDEWPETIVTAGGAGWTPSETTDVDFAALAMLPGIPGFSGDLAALPVETRAAIAQWITVYKRWRSFICRSAAYPLTPPMPLQIREGWSAVELQVPGEECYLVFAYRLKRSMPILRLKLFALNRESRYWVSDPRRTDESLGIFSGNELLDNGLPVEIARENQARMFIVEKA